MMEFYVSGQSLKMFTPVTAADSLKYLTAQFHFTDNEWDGYTRWAHFRKGETVYDIALDGDDRITEEDALNLTAGEWDIYLTGTKDTARLTTVVVILTVKESGLIDAPLHVIPQSVAEQIDAKAAQALLTAQAVKVAADAGKFNGRDGKSFEIKGYYASTAALETGVPEPAPGDAYCVGSAAPYDVYIYDGVNGEWVNNGTIQGATGPAGKSAYAAAVEAGYTGTEATFYAALTAMPYHNARHLPDGADPITVKAGNLAASAVETAKIKDKAVTRAKLANDALSSTVKWVSESPYTVIADDLERTIVFDGTLDTVQINISESLFNALPTGWAVAFMQWSAADTTKLTITVDSNLYIGKAGEKSGALGGSVTTNVSRTMIVAKRITSQSLLVFGITD